MHPISRDVVKDRVFSRVEANIELPTILQTLENRGFNDQLMDLLASASDKELAYIKSQVEAQTGGDLELQKLAFRENSEVCEKNLKKILQLMISDIWRENSRKTARQYADVQGINYSYGSYHYDNYVGPYYYIQEQKRLKKIVRHRLEECISGGKKVKMANVNDAKFGFDPLKVGK